MQNKLDRAKQFLPFDALKGFQEELQKIEEEVEKEGIDYLSHFKVGDKVMVRYYYQIEYMEVSGAIKKIDYHNQLLFFSKTAISFSDIIDIKQI